MAVTERIIRATTVVPTTGSSGLAPTPFQFILGSDDRLRVTTFGFRTGADLDITVRQWRDATSDVVVTGDTLRNPTAISGLQRDIGLTAGALLNVRIGTHEPLVRYGHVFVRVQLVHGAGPATMVMGTLLQGYVSDANDLGWPGSPLQAMHAGRGVIVDGGWGVLAAPLRISATVPPGARWRVISGAFTLTTSAVAGPRALAVRALEFGTLPAWWAVAAPDQPAGTTVVYNLGAGMPPTALISNSDAYLPWPNDLELAAGAIVETRVIGEQAGDSIGTQGLLVREWLDQ